MSASAEITAPSPLVSPKIETYRNTAWCAFWSAIVIAGPVVAALPSVTTHIMGVLVGVYGLQGLLAEWLGIRISSTRLSAPQHSRSFPRLDLWRARGSLGSIESVTALRSGNGRLVLLRWLEGYDTLLMFPDSARKLKFFDAIRRGRPDIGIWKEG